jgi:diguanylate cyclase (GGDEF)-like protein
LVVSASVGVLGLAVLLPWTTTGAQAPAARATWVLLHQVALATLAIMAWITPRLSDLRHGATARAAAVAVGFQLALSVWNNQLGGAVERYGTPLDVTVRTLLTVAGGVAIVTVLALITRRSARIAGHDMAAVVDATVVSTAMGLLVWETLTSWVALTRTSAIVVSLATAIVVASTAVFVRLLLSPGRNCGAVRLLTVGLVLGTVSLVIFSLDAIAGARPRSHWWELPLLLAYATVVAAVLHPSMHDLVDGRAREREALAAESTVRALVLCAAVVMPAGVTLARAVAAIDDAATDQWATLASLPAALAGVVITVGVAWRLARLVSDRAQAHHMLEHRSRHDDLTGLPNRAYLIERLRDAIDRQRARPTSDTAGFGLMFLDLDDFKSINDSYGHQAGDVVLINVARRLAGAVRTDDLAGRMAGDEFVLLCGEPSDEASLAGLADRVRATVEAPMPVEFGVVTPRVSIGVIIVDHTLASADDAVSTILRAVDDRMYESKRAARGAGASPAGRLNQPDRGHRRARDEAT